jgi:DNA polymerase III subunit delta
MIFCLNVYFTNGCRTFGAPEWDDMPAYLLHNDVKQPDPLLVRRRLAELLKGIDMEGNLNFQAFDLNESGTSIHDVVSSALTIPFLGGQRVVVARGIKSVERSFRNKLDEEEDEDGNPAEKSEDAREDVKEEDKKHVSNADLIVRSIMQLKNLPDNALLIFVEESGHLDGRSVFMKALKKIGCNVEEFKAMFFDPASGNIKNAVDYIQKEGSRFKIRLDYVTAKAFADRVGSDRGAIERELQKLAIYCGSGASPTVDDVNSVVTESYEAGIFQLVDYIGYNKTGKALDELADLMDRGAAAPYILTMIARQLRLIVQVREAIEDGIQPDEKVLASYLKIHWFVAQKVLRQARSFRNYDYKKMLEYLSEADVRLKRGSMASKVPGKLALEMLITRLSDARISGSTVEPPRR